MSGRTIGYARTASSEKDIGAQIDMLKAAGCAVVYTDAAVSGSTLERPGLTRARADLQPGDTLKVVGLNHVARSASALHSFVMDLRRNHISIESLDNAAATSELRDVLN